MSAWNKVVQEQYKAGKAKNPAFSLKDAMFAAKKVYKTGTQTVDSVANAVTAPLKRKTRRGGKKAKKSNRGKTARRS